MEAAFMSNKTRPSCLLEAFSPEDVNCFFFFHLVAPASHSEKNQDTETIKDFPESQSKIERLIP